MASAAIYQVTLLSLEVLPPGVARVKSNSMPRCNKPSGSAHILYVIHAYIYVFIERLPLNILYCRVFFMSTGHKNPKETNKLKRATLGHHPSAANRQSYTLTEFEGRIQSNLLNSKIVRLSGGIHCKAAKAGISDC